MYTVLLKVIYQNCSTRNDNQLRTNGEQYCHKRWHGVGAATKCGRVFLRRKKENCTGEWDDSKYARSFSRVCRGHQSDMWDQREVMSFFPLRSCSRRNLRVFYFRGIIVEKLVEYMCFKSQYENIGPKEDIPLKEFQERIPPEIVLELCVHTFTFFVVKVSFVFRLLAADYQESGCLIMLPCLWSHLGFCSVIYLERQLMEEIFVFLQRLGSHCHDGRIVEIAGIHEVVVWIDIPWIRIIFSLIVRRKKNPCVIIQNGTKRNNYNPHDCLNVPFMLYENEKVSVWTVQLPKFGSRKHAYTAYFCVHSLLTRCASFSFSL